MRERYRTLSLKNKVKVMMCITLIPMVLFICYLISRMGSYGDYFGKVYENIALANSFVQDFHTQYDYSMYRIIIGSSSFELEEPFNQIEEAVSTIEQLQRDTTVSNNKVNAKQILKNLQSLRNSTDIIYQNQYKQGPKYDRNMEILDNDIRTTTLLIQEKAQEYVFYETFELKHIREQMLKEIRYTMTLAITILAVILVVTFFLIDLLSNSITKPIKDICTAIQSVGEGDFTTRADISEVDEITALTVNFNSMTEQIGALVEKVKEEELNVRQTELKLLQAQINPHFIYNTMDTIVWLAADGMNQDVIDIVMAFSDFFRTSLSKGKDFINLSEEVKHIKSYFTIQKFRYSDILDYEIDIPEELWQYQILKLTLQPLIENAIYHGIKNKRGRGLVRIQAVREGENIKFFVKDNGIGMKEEEVDRLREKIAQSKVEDGEGGFGLVNVNERIKLNYGHAYGLHLESTYGEGTEMIICIPAIS